MISKKDLLLKALEVKAATHKIILTFKVNSFALNVITDNTYFVVLRGDKPVAISNTVDKAIYFFNGMFFKKSVHRALACLLGYETIHYLYYTMYNLDLVVDLKGDVLLSIPYESIEKVIELDFAPLINQNAWGLLK